MRSSSSPAMCSTARSALHSAPAVSPEARTTALPGEIKFNGRFKQMDGVDISDVNLANAKLWCKTNDVEVPVLYRNNGADLSAIGSEHYDVVLSTICMQHICVHEIRFNLFGEMFRI